MNVPGTLRNQSIGSTPCVLKKKKCPETDIIGYGWVGGSKLAKKYRISFMDSPNKICLPTIVKVDPAAMRVTSLSAIVLTI